MVKTNIFVGNLEAIRKAKNLTIPEFARCIGIPKSTLCSLLTTGNATLDTLMRISEGLDIPLWRLFYDERQSARGSICGIEEFNTSQWVLTGIDALSQLSPEGRRKIAFMIEEVLRDDARDAVATTC